MLSKCRYRAKLSTCESFSFFPCPDPDVGGLVDLGPYKSLRIIVPEGDLPKETGRRARLQSWAILGSTVLWGVS